MIMMNGLRVRVPKPMRCVVPLSLAMLAGCSQPAARPETIRVQAEARTCPAYPLPDPRLMRRPMRTDFLNPPATR